MNIIFAYIMAVAGFLAGMYYFFVADSSSKALVYLCCTAVFSLYIVRKRRQARKS